MFRAKLKSIASFLRLRKCLQQPSRRRTYGHAYIDSTFDADQEYIFCVAYEISFWVLRTFSQNENTSASLVMGINILMAIIKLVFIKNYS